MEILGAPLVGVRVERGPRISDERGGLRRLFEHAGQQSRDPSGQAQRILVSWNPELHTLRGFHYQVPPVVEAKTLTCLTGSLFDVVIDLRKQSTTYCQWMAVRLSASDDASILVPRGCANAWLTTHENTLVHYVMHDAYSQECARGIRFDDPTFEVPWPHSPAVMSDRDMAWPLFDRQTDGL